jgi:tetratricopeptide (TPR) repeat protein
MNWILVSFLMILTGNPILALILILVFYGVLDRQYFGFFPQISQWVKRRQEISRLLTTLSINPNDLSARLALGRAYVINREPEKAVPHLEPAFERMKEMPDVHYYLGRAYLKTGQAEKGKALILKTIEMDPRFQYGEPYLRLGEYCLSVGDFEKARELLETFCSIHTSSSEGFYHLGQAHLGLGNKTKAAESFKKSIEVCKISPRYKRQIDRKWAWKSRKTMVTTL